GLRIEPPPSPACATGVMCAATAAAAPPLDPPHERATSHGLRVGPYAAGSVVSQMPSSGTLVRPTTTKPAARSFATRYEVDAARCPACFRKRVPQWIGSPSA